MPQKTALPFPSSDFSYNKISTIAKGVFKSAYQLELLWVQVHIYKVAS